MERGFRPRGFGERRGFGAGFEKPVKEGETYDVEITEIGTRGDGIARVKNFVIFIPNTKRGEKCKIRITEVRRRFAIAEKVGKEEEAPKKEEEAPEAPAEEEKAAEEAEAKEETSEEEEGEKSKKGE